MDPESIPTTELDPLESNTRSRWVWIVFFALALLFHIFLFWIRLDWTSSPPAPRVEVENMDSSQVDQIRQKWKEKSLLLNKDKSKAQPEEAPPDARYFSDRNRRVEKEQRARDTQVVPKPGKPSQGKEQAQSETESKSYPSLGSLGVPFNLNRDPVNSSPKLSGMEGGDQALLDQQLPIGSENLLNTQESIYYSFYARLYEAIGPVWQSLIRSTQYRRKVVPGDYQTVVDVVFDEHGNLKGVNRVYGSGIEEFDRAVYEAWQRIGKFPNPPRGLLDQNRQVHTGWTFSVHVGDGFNLNYRPPERNY